MKKIALALLFVFTTGSAMAQTYTCQFIMSAGMDKDPKKGWAVKTFKLREPFFLNISDGLIDTKSLTEPPSFLLSFSAACMKQSSPALGVSHWCAGYSSYLSFSEKTLNGASARTFGALDSTSVEDPDSVTVSRFKCQKVR